MIEKITLERTGQAPLKFDGELVATANGQFVNTRPTKPNVDWFEISIYRVSGTRDGPPFIVAITYRKKLKGSASEIRLVHPTNDAAELLTQFDPLLTVAWPPDAEQFARKRETLRERVLKQWHHLVSTVLADFPQEISS